MKGSRDADVFIPLGPFHLSVFKNSNQMAEEFRADWKC